MLSGADKDSVGSLLSVDEGDGIVRVKATGEVKFFSLKNLAKLHKTLTQQDSSDVCAVSCGCNRLNCHIIAYTLVLYVIVINVNY